MRPNQKRRLFTVLSVVIAVGSAAALALYALRQNVNLYYTPTQLLALSDKTPAVLRLGGLVVKGSVQHTAHTLAIRFTLTDGHHQIPVQYTGILPTLFREGQGIVAEGNMRGPWFVASQVLAKHDANYHPPEIPIKLPTANE